MKSAPEPAMDEILSSIRRIITEDQAAARRRASGTQTAPAGSTAGQRDGDYTKAPPRRSAEVLELEDLVDEDVESVDDEEDGAILELEDLAPDSENEESLSDADKPSRTGSGDDSERQRARAERIAERARERLARREAQPGPVFGEAKRAEPPRPVPVDVSYKPAEVARPAAPVPAPPPQVQEAAHEAAETKPPAHTVAQEPKAAPAPTVSTPTPSVSAPAPAPTASPQPPPIDPPSPAPAAPAVPSPAAAPQPSQTPAGAAKLKLVSPETEARVVERLQGLRNVAKLTRILDGAATTEGGAMGDSGNSGLDAELREMLAPKLQQWMEARVPQMAENVLSDEIKPQLQRWMDENLTAIVERVVREEIQSMIKGS